MSERGATTGDADPTRVLPEPATSRLELSDTEVGSVFVSNYPPYSQWSAEAVAEYRSALARQPATDAPLGLYLHIPFCRKRCNFCYFRVYTDKSADEVQVYCEALANEISTYAAAPAIEGRPLRFIYFGGGTPSYIAAKHLARLIGRIKNAFPWEQVQEVTFECEPGTLSRSKLEALRELGITRLSLGVENFDDRVLQINGRAHVGKEIHRVIPWIQALEFDSVNMDLIAGMLGETWETWRASVDRMIDYAPDSVTVYQMELPFNTRFSRQYMQGTLEEPPADWALKREWHAYAFEKLADAGYELSSAYTMVRAGSGARFTYRDALWHGADMLGTGVSSFGHLQGVHVQNTANWLEYLHGIARRELPLHRAYSTTADDRLVRELILQMKTGGVSVAYFHDKFGVDITERFAAAMSSLREAGMLASRDGRVELNPQGLLQVDSLLPEFYAPEHRNARYT